jgi:hypothetical protein
MSALEPTEAVARISQAPRRSTAATHFKAADTIGQSVTGALAIGAPPTGAAARGIGQHGTEQHGRTTRPPLPRRRDLRAGRGGRVAPPPAPRVSVASPAAGIALGLRTAPSVAPGLPAESPFSESPFFGVPALAVPAPTELEISSPALPRRRDVRRAEQDSRTRRSQLAARKRALLDAASARTPWSATTVARGAVVTGLVAVGVVAITGQRLDLAGLTPSGSETTAELAAVPARPTTPSVLDSVPLTGEVSYWDGRAESDAVVAGGVRDLKLRAAAAKRAAAKRTAEKAAAAARVAAKAEALRNAQRDPRGIGKIMAAERGWTGEQWTCLDLLWTKESKWKWNADNPSSSAYGIPQALPGRKMASAGSDWATNPVTQIKWGLNYIDTRYGTPCSAWSHSKATNWY